MRAVLHRERALGAARLAELDALIARHRAPERHRRRSRLRAALRQRAQHVAAPVRARARRFARPRPGDDRPGPDVREGRPLPRTKARCPITCRWCSSMRRRSRRRRRAPSWARSRTSSTSSSTRWRSAAAAYASVLGALLELAGEKAQDGQRARRRAARRKLGRAGRVRRLRVARPVAPRPGAADRDRPPDRPIQGART